MHIGQLSSQSDTASRASISATRGLMPGTDCSSVLYSWRVDSKNSAGTFVVAWIRLQDWSRARLYTRLPCHKLRKFLLEPTQHDIPAECTGPRSWLELLLHCCDFPAPIRRPFARGCSLDQNYFSLSSTSLDVDSVGGAATSNWYKSSLAKRATSTRNRRQ